MRPRPSGHGAGSGIDCKRGADKQSDCVCGGWARGVDLSAGHVAASSGFHVEKVLKEVL